MGHAYTTVMADILARYRRLKGDDVYFLTGVDENSEKIVRVAKSLGPCLHVLTDTHGQKKQADQL
jgi:methionyl-tRNA synthetase